MRNFLVHTRDAEKAAYLWNVIAYTGSSFQSMLLMLVISRRGNMIDTAITSIAFTVASMFLLVGKYAIRNYQVSDIKNEYTYKDYLYARGITILWMVLVAAFYLAYCYIYKEYSVALISHKHYLPFPILGTEDAFTSSLLLVSSFGYTASNASKVCILCFCIIKIKLCI